MGIIKVLDEHIANQIAAGEVVERPSSVVKELVENSVDAGSTRVEVTIEEGGLQLIRVLDNGSGMQTDDCETAFQRHATSKLGTGKDLFQIRTLGFRGEALPSIAAVAKVECTTAADTGGLARKIVIEGGSVRSFSETAAPKGTDILVKELFYNTPARLKYMKTIQTELGHISDYLYRLAIAHPGVAFTLKHNGHVLLQTLGNGDLLQVMAAIYGSASAKQMVSLTGESLDYAITGYISKPELTRANKQGISIVVNGRYIRNNAVSHAVMRAYHTLLPIGRYPFAALHIRMEPTLLDVNVHPSKLEVRFSKETELMECVEKAIKEALNSQVLIPKGPKISVSKTAFIQEQLDLYRANPAAAAVEPAREAWNGMNADTYNAQPSANSSAGTVQENRRDITYPRHPENNGGPSVVPSYERGAGTAAYPQSAGWRQSSRPETRPGNPARQASPYGNGSASAYPAKPISAERLAALGKSPDGADTAQLPPFPHLDPIGQLHGTYLVAQNEDGLFLVDQHAAHERINYEYYYEQFGRPADASQELLVPITLEFTPSEAELMKTRLPVFEQAGVYIEHFGGNGFLVRAYPHWFPEGEEKSIIEEMAEYILSEKHAVDIAKLREKSSTMCSCKASIKANQNLGRMEMEVLLDRLAACKNPYTCPHGRPIVVSFSSYELQKMFKRVM